MSWRSSATSSFLGLTMVTWGVIGTSTCALPAKSVECGEPSVELFGNACDVCAARECCPLAEECAADEECLALATCMQGCADTGEASCFTDCRLDNFVADRKFDDLANCAGGCVEEDPACVLPEQAAESCDADPSVVEAFGPGACAACIERNACDEAKACSADEVCLSRLTCFTERCQQRPEPACYDECLGDHPYRQSEQDDVATTQSAFDAFMAALNSSTKTKQCTSACGFGRALGCAGDYDWPAATDNTVFVSMQLRKFTGEVFLEGFEVTAISNDDGGTFSADMVTDADGFAVVRALPTTAITGSSGFFGWLEIQPPTPSMGEDEYLPTILYRDRPEWRDRVDPDDVPMATQSILDAGLGITPGRALVTGQLFDCYASFNWGIEGAVIEVDRGNVLYVDRLQTSPDPPTRSEGRFAVTDIEGDGDLTIVARDLETGAILAEARVPVLIDGVTQAGIYPDTL